MGPGLDWDTHLETWICRGGTTMELRSNSLYLDGCETWNGWMWDANIMTWLKVRCNTNWRILGHRSMWDGAWRGESISWECGVRTGMEVRDTFSNVDGLEIWDVDGDEMHFLGPALGLDINWIVVRQKCGILDWVAARPGWRWHVNLGAWVDMGRDVGRDVGIILRPALSLNGAWLEVSHDMDGG